MNDIIKTENLSREYGDVKAVSSLNLSVRKREIYGFLGLNGAGKTTTIRMLLGMVRPTSGAVYIQGEKVHANHTELWKKIGHLVETPNSYPNLTVRENLEIIRRLRLLPDKANVKTIIEKLQLGPYTNRKAKNLSLGNKQRLGLAKALIHTPEILILDEPTNGLDPAGIHDVREMLNDLAENHDVSIFISSHILGEISRFATRIGIIHEGRLVEEIDAGQLESLCKKQLLIRTKDLRAAHEIIVKNGFKNSKIENETIKIEDEAAVQNPDKVATILVNANCPPSLLYIKEEDLESYFLRIINKNESIK
ncbi:MAG: ABC transporter ATP-binding protein [Bacteroidales bacterium]|nr:ABC transporter ATP-binding protein [Bacteroidales bacterium]MCF8404110.1 ABC transporter ATP-binding protein [Bacteroidales bacterium]